MDFIKKYIVQITLKQELIKFMYWNYMHDLDNLRTKKGKLILSITSTFVDGEKIISETFNSSFLNNDVYLICIQSNSVSCMSFLIKRLEGSFSSPITQARGATATLLLDNNGVVIFGDVRNIIGLEIYELTIN